MTRLYSAQRDVHWCSANVYLNSYLNHKSPPLNIQCSISIFHVKASLS